MADVDVFVIVECNIKLLGETNVMYNKKRLLFLSAAMLATFSVVTLKSALGNAFTASLLNPKSSLVASKPVKHKFKLCGVKCQNAGYYVAYGRENQVKLGQQVAKYSNTELNILPDIKDALNGKINIDEQIMDKEDGNVVNSTHRIARLQIGNLLKSENMNVLTTEANSMAQAKVKLAWGDLITVTSRTLPKGTPVKIQLNRVYGGYAATATDNAYYKAMSKTYVNSEPLPSLEYNLQKDVGPGKKDVIIGNDKASQDIEVKVGDSISLEGWLEVIDGVKGNFSTAKEKAKESLVGADSSKHSVSLVNANQDLCLKSASGVFSAGNCN